MLLVVIVDEREYHRQEHSLSLMTRQRIFGKCFCCMISENQHRIKFYASQTSPRHLHKFLFTYAHSFPKKKKALVLSIFMMETEMNN